MRTMTLGQNGPEASVIALGCMRIAGMAEKDAESLVMKALESGITLYDHADIYGGGESERLFGQVLKLHPGLREKIVLQTKCGIKKGLYDLSGRHIVQSVEDSLQRLQAEYVDLYLLHRPDALMEPEEIAAALEKLYSQGKIRGVGVSNQTPGQMEILGAALPMPIITNQLQLSILHAGMIRAGIHANMAGPEAVDHDGGVLDYCRLKHITIQAWSPFQYGFFEGTFLGNPMFPDLNTVLEHLAARYQVSSAAIATAWILRHPARIQPVIGTTNPDRVMEIAAAAEVTLSREEWYEIYLKAGNTLP